MQSQSGRTGNSTSRRLKKWRYGVNDDSTVAHDEHGLEGEKQPQNHNPPLKEWEMRESGVCRGTELHKAAQCSLGMGWAVVGIMVVI